MAGVHCPIAMIASHDINEDNGQGAETENPEEGDAGLDDETNKEKIDLGQQIHSGCEANAAPELSIVAVGVVGIRSVFGRPLFSDNV